MLVRVELWYKSGVALINPEHIVMLEPGGDDDHSFVYLTTGGPLNAKGTPNELALSIERQRKSVEG